MARRTITLSFDSGLYDKIEKRAKKNYVEVLELIEDIVRRSMLSYKEKAGTASQKVDDSLVGIFSRERKGRKKKRK